MSLSAPTSANVSAPRSGMVRMLIAVAEAGAPPHRHTITKNTVALPPPTTLNRPRQVAPVGRST